MLGWQTELSDARKEFKTVAEAESMLAALKDSAPGRTGTKLSAAHGQRVRAVEQVRDELRAKESGS